MNEQVRVAEGVNGTIVVMGAWCPTCRQETQPSSDGSCNWCHRPVIDEETLDVRALLAQIRDGTPPSPPTQEALVDATATHYCKFPSCTNEARSSVGRYSYCDDHQGMGAAKRTAAANGGGTVEQRIKSLAALARDVDKAKARAKKLTEDALNAKTAAEEKERDFQRQARAVLGEEIAA